MNDVISVADTILRIAKARGQLLTPLMLVKLSYISNGFSLAIRGKSLFPNRIEAWEFGPNIPDLYRGTLKHGRKEIPEDVIDDGEKYRVSDEVVVFLREMFDSYGHLAGEQLSYLTQLAGSPWDKAYQNGGVNVIAAQDIRNYYIEQLAQTIPA